MLTLMVANIMNKSLYSFPLKPLVVALATAQCLTTAHAEPLPAEVTISDSSHAAPYVVASDKLTITPDGIVSTNSERFAVRNSKNTSLVDNQGYNYQ